MPGAERKRSSLACALGIRVHSGWGAAVVISLEDGAAQVLDRQRVEIVDASSKGAAQPYHFAKTLAIDSAESYLQACAKTSAQLAREAIQKMATRICDQGAGLCGAAILLSAGRPLPSLARILASHPLIHTAEGDFFRQAFRTACEELEVPVSGIRERDLDREALSVFGRGAGHMKDAIAEAGNKLGPPWTQDQKLAALAAAVLLADKADNIVQNDSSNLF